MSPANRVAIWPPLAAKSRHALRLLTLVAVLSAWWSPAVAAEPDGPPPPPDAKYAFCIERATPRIGDLDRLFDTEPGGVMGADYQRAHALPDGRVLWTFQDAEIRRAGGGFTRIHNLGVLQDANCFWILYGGTRANPRSWLFASETTPLRHWYWALDSAVGTDGRLYIYAAEMVERSPSGYLDHTEPVSTRVAVFDPATSRIVDTAAPPNSSAALYGWSTTADDEWTYLYGHCYRQFGFDVFALKPAFDRACSSRITVARVPRGELWAAHQYWDGVRWQSDPGRAAALTGLAGDPSNASQFRYAGNRFWVVNKEGDWWGERIHVYVSERPTGPFQRVASHPQPLKCAECNTFFADWVPPEAIGRPPGTLVYGLSHNRWSGEVTADYRPTFHEVTGVAYPMRAGDILRLHVADPGVAAAALNVTAVDPDAAGYLTVFACDRARPTASNLNFGSAGPATAIANLTVTGLDAAGDACVFAGGAAGMTVDVVVDVAGTFDEPVEIVLPDGGAPLEPSGLSGFVAADAPVRVADTREDGTRPGADGVVELTLPPQADGASGVVLNLTAVGPDGPGFLTAYACDAPRPATSNLNYLAGDVVAALAVVPVGPDARVCVYTLSGSDVVVDYAGSFVGAGYASLGGAVRLVDTRRTGTLQAATEVAFGLPAGVTGAATLTVTAVGPHGPGFVTVHACDQPLPTASNLNYAAAGDTGRATANLTLATASADGAVCVYTPTTTDLVVDLAGVLPIEGGYVPLPNPRRLIDTRLVGFDQG